MKNFWTVLFVILVILVGLRLLGFIFSIGFILLRIAIPVAIIGFAIYGFLEFTKKQK